MEGDDGTRRPPTKLDLFEKLAQFARDTLRKVKTIDKSGLPPPAEYTPSEPLEETNADDQQARAEEPEQLDGLALLEATVKKNNRFDSLLFGVDKLLAELVVEGGERNKYITFAPLNSFARKLLHIMAERYGMKSSSFPGFVKRWPACCTCCYNEHEFKRVVIVWNSGAKQPNELVGDIVFRMRGKRSRLDTSRGKGKYATHPPVWVSREARKRESEGMINEEDTGESSAKVDWASLPSEMWLEVFLYLNCEDLVCAGLTCRQWNGLSMEPYLWRQLSLPWLSAQKAPSKCDHKHRDAADKPREKRDDEPWREFFIANVFWANRLPRKLLQRYQYDARHSHRLLGTSICTRPHI